MFSRLRIPKLLAILLLPACAFWNAVEVYGVLRETVTVPTEDSAVEWPTTWRGRSLRPLALSDVERRFARGFPGKIARLTDGRDMLIWRHIARPTRMLHPATDCYRALGWRIRDEQLEEAEDNRQGGRWRCFVAERGNGGERLRVCEHIEDRARRDFTDASAWYWAAVTGQSVGPWLAVTVASPL
ncbi:MAG: hypothetical protein LBP58_10995 [Azoarcus sp.]|jgi:hypothetical protein|nr:hypothetical protein [Azoarcus sp.]